MPSTLWKSVMFALLVLFALAPRVPAGSSEWPPEPPDDVELAALQDLARWVDSSPDSNRHASARRLPAGLRRAIAEGRESFQLFRAYNGKESCRKRLASVPFGSDIYRVAESNEIDPLLLAAVVEAESNFSPTAVSPVGAVGLAQVMPSTASHLSAEELSNPVTNLDLGARYLRHLLERFDDNLELAIAAYNAGPTSVDRYEGIPPYRETRNYVEKVLSIYVAHHRSLWRRSVVRDLLRG